MTFPLILHHTKDLLPLLLYKGRYDMVLSVLNTASTDFTNTRHKERQQSKPAHLEVTLSKLSTGKPQLLLSHYWPQRAGYNPLQWLPMPG